MAACLQLLDNIETAQRQNKLFAALKEGHEAIKQLQKEVTLEDVETLMSDTAEAKEQQVLPHTTLHGPTNDPWS